MMPQKKLSKCYSTTCLVTNELPVIKKNPKNKLETAFFLPEDEGRQGLGGLRTQGNFKASHPNKPLITVVTAVFNCDAMLEKSILSVINQTYDNVEYIIIDGCSTDGTVDLIRQYEHAIDYWVSEPDNGIYDAWNKGLRLASGEWIAFLGGDDSYFECALEEYVYSIVDCRDRQLHYISSRINLRAGDKVVRTIGQQWSWKTFQRYMNVAHVGSLHSRVLFEKYGIYDTNYRVCGDYEFLLRPRERLKAAYLNLTTVNMSVGGASDNSLALCEMERAKVVTGGRNFFISRIERIIATFKLRLRKWLWY